MTRLVLCQAVPEGDWFCPDCRPKQRSRRLTSRQQRHPVPEEERDGEDVEEQDEEESAEEEEPAELLDEEAAVRYDGRHF